MKTALFLVLLMTCLTSQALEIYPYEPGLGTIYFANFFSDPMSLGVHYADDDYLAIQEGTVWNTYQYWTDGLPITGTAKLNESTLMVAMGSGTYSDGVYNFNLNTHQWAINEWFIRPNFLVYCPANQKHYVGEREGLFYTANGSDWYRISSLGANPCTSFASFGTRLICNNGSIVWYSTDAALSWQQANLSNLRGFRYSADGNKIYGIMSVGSDSDGIWSSEDSGATWSPEFYSDNINAIGPDFNGQIPLGWSQPNENGNYLELWLQASNQFVALPGLNGAVKQLEIFPLVNTPSFYVINNTGLYWLTNFLQVGLDDELLPAVQSLQLKTWPNPAKSALHLEFEEKQDDLRVELFDLRGRKLFAADKTKVQNRVLDLKLPELSRGVYLLKVSLEQGSVLHKIRIY
ncbi:MAG TPA: T9SS type A sorting domain-containing protein [Candidatus Cloacimonadota bacterium]|nr:T9SS type A sorting domain-containing protein [Candidatus Cloacimonadota bacterium]